MTRLLTKHEINYILNKIDPLQAIPKVIANSICKIQRKAIKDQLKQIKIYPRQIPKLGETIFRQYIKTLVDAGESVGGICAQSVGERQTQLTLNSFHMAGMIVSTVTTGVPRFMEIIDANYSPLTSSSVIYTKNQHPTIQSLRNEVGSSIVGVTLSNLIIDYDIISNPKPRKWYKIYEKIYSPVYKNHTSYMLTCKLNLVEMFRYGLTMEMIKTKIELFSDIFCVISPLSEAIIDIYVDQSNINLGEFTGIKEEDKIKIYLRQVCYPEIKNIYLCGIPSIEKMYYKKGKMDWYLETVGTDLEKVLSLPFVDTTKTYSTCMKEILVCLGIEATREFLIQELKTIISSDGTSVNERHISLLVDFMTQSGNITAITRNGARSHDTGFLSKMSFEEVLGNILSAGVYGKSDPIEGVSSSIIAGKMGNYGTGMCDLVLDIDKLTPNL